MSVGAGSIKRAAKAAEGNTETIAAQETAEPKAPKAVKETAKPKASKAVKETAEPKASKAVKETAKPKAAKENVEADSSHYTTYGVGQELPVYLM